jgi:DNA-binding transcriptional MerR regulator
MRHDDPDPDTPLDLTELARLAEVSPRTVRYYLQQGLLPAPVGRGPGAHYTGAHLARLRLIRAWQERHQPLATIRAALERLDDAGVRAALAQIGPRASRPTTTALEYVRALLGEPMPSSVAKSVPPAPAPAPMATPAPTSPDAAVAGALGAPLLASTVGAPGERTVAEDARRHERVVSAHDTHDAHGADAPPGVDQLALFPRPGRATWERHTISADVELHIRRPLTRDQQRRVDRLLDLAAQLFREDA